MTHRNSFILMLVASAFSLASVVGCVSAKSLTYLQDMENDTPYDAPPPPEIVVGPGDILGISVSSEDPRLAAPFSVSPDEGSTSSSGVRIRYHVGSDGCISFPVVGVLKVKGMTLGQVRDEISRRIVEMGYIKEPVVGVVLENFSITVLGGVSNAVISVDTPSINLFQLIARSGGTSEDVKIKEVTVIREENGQRTAYAVNLQKKDVFYSPVFYLRQNDIVYFKPRGTRLGADGQTAMSFIGTGLSLASIIVNFILWSNR